MKRFLSAFVSVLALTAFAAIVVMAYRLPHPDEPLSRDAQQFKAFEAAYIHAYEIYRLDKFEKSVKDELVTWEGRVRDISNTGSFLDIVPLNYSGTGGANAPWLECAAFLPEGVYVPTNLKRCQKIRVTGNISSVGENRSVILRDAKLWVFE